AWTLLGQIAWLRADRTEALRCLDRAIELFDSWPDTPEKAQAYAELGRLHMLNCEHAPALGATEIAAEIAERLGLVELRANALITIGMCRYQAGEPDGLVDLQEALEFCRTHQLPSLRRATQNVAYALREEGDRSRSDRLLTEGLPISAGGGSLVTGYSFEALQALFAGDWDRFLAVADAFLDSPTGEWDLQIRGVRAWMRAARGDEPGATTDLQQALSTARASGFWRLHWTALGHGALCQAVLDKRDDATAMLDELASTWRRMRTVASGEWVAAAAHAAVLLEPDAASLLRDALADAPHHTAWSRAALIATQARLDAAGGDHAAAAARLLDAADRYAGMGSETDRMVTLSAAARQLSAAGDPRAESTWADVLAFAGRNRAAGLLLDR
ncbi:MAG TPA: adenylyl cyclase, partial [Micromonosporaceae bacterium]